MRFSDAILAVIGKYCPHLIKLVLESVKPSSITNDGVLNLTSSCLTISYLNLGECPNLTISCIQHLARVYQESLKYLKIIGSKAEFDETYFSLCKYRVVLA
jgi:hypothetical protein